MRSALVALCALAAAHAQASPRTGALVEPAAKPRPPALGGEGPAFVLYLRADGSALTRAAISAALAALARIPDAHIELYVEPNDRDAAFLADSFADLPSEASRRGLLATVCDQGLPSTTTPRSLRAAPHRFYSRSSGSGKALLRRPPGLHTASTSFLSLAQPGAAPLSVDDVEALRTSERSLAPVEALPASRDAVGSALAAHELRIHARLPLRDPVRAVLPLAMMLLEEGRLRIRVEAVDPEADASPVDRLFARGLRSCGSAARLHLLGVIANAPPPADEAQAVWLLQSAGVDPGPLLSAPDGPGRPDLGPDLDLDEVPIRPGDLERKVRLPSLRTRLKAPSP